ncbi:MAG: ABC transporter permease [Lachnospiraceae bacterium]
MINFMQRALIKKDIRSVTANKQIFSVLLIVPLVMTVVLPSVFILIVILSPTDSEDFQQLLALLPVTTVADPVHMVIKLLLDSILPIFFLLIPIMAASVMAASSFVGEKEKHTLETLLYSPMTIKQIYHAKVYASFVLSMFVALSSFVVMILVVEIEVRLLTGVFILPGLSWLPLIIVVSPALSLIAITLIVQGSAKAQSVEESQQRSVFLILPIILLAVGQFAGVMLINEWMLLALGAVLAAIAWLLLKRSFKGLGYERLLK